MVDELLEEHQCNLISQLVMVFLMFIKLIQGTTPPPWDMLCECVTASWSKLLVEIRIKGNKTVKSQRSIHTIKQILFNFAKFCSATPQKWSTSQSAGCDV